MNALSLYMHAVLCVECIMIVRMTLCSLDWVSVLCVATCVNKVTYAGCVYKLKCLPIVLYDNFYYSHTLTGPYHTLFGYYTVVIRTLLMLDHHKQLHAGVVCKGCDHLPHETVYTC